MYTELNLDTDQKVERVMVIGDYASIKFDGNLKIDLTADQLAKIVELYNKRIDLNKMLESLRDSVESEELV